MGNNSQLPCGIKFWSKQPTFSWDWRTSFSGPDAVGLPSLGSGQGSCVLLELLQQSLPTPYLKWGEAVTHLHQRSNLKEEHPPDDQNAVGNQSLQAPYSQQPWVVPLSHMALVKSLNFSVFCFGHHKMKRVNTTEPTVLQTDFNGREIVWKHQYYQAHCSSLKWYLLLQMMKEWFINSE